MELEKKNLLLALLISFAVGLAGAVLWGLAYYFEFFAAIISYVSAFAMFKVYEKFYSINKLTFVWIIGISILLNVIACIVVIAILFPGYNVFEVISLTSETKVAFITDILFSIVFTVAGVVSVVSYNKKRERQQSILNQYEMEKLKQEVNNAQTDNEEVSSEVIEELKNDMKNLESNESQTTDVEVVDDTTDDKNN